MKPTLWILFVCGVSAATAQPPQSAPVMRDVATHQQLAQQLGQAGQVDPMRQLPVSSGEDPTSKALPKDLISQSDILCFGGVATLVPKRALLAAPANLKERLTLSAGARIVGWVEFFSVNRGWITTEEVSFAQAEGKQPLPAAAAERIGKSTSLVVATYLGGPISVHSSAPVSPVSENKN